MRLIFNQTDSKDCSLVDIQLYNPSNQNIRIFSAIFNTESAILLNGKSAIIHGLNPHLLLSDNEEYTLDYLQFFSSYIRGDAGPIQIISNLNEIPVDKRSNQQLQEIEAAFFNPRFVKGKSGFEKEEGTKIEAFLLIGNALHIAVIKVFQSGKTSLESAKCIFENLSILRRQYDGVFRTPLFFPND